MLWVNFEEVRVGFPCVTWFAGVLGEQSGRCNIMPMLWAWLFVEDVGLLD